MSGAMAFVFKYVVSHMHVDSKRKKKSLRKPLAVDSSLTPEG